MELAGVVEIASPESLPEPRFGDRLDGLFGPEAAYPARVLRREREEQRRRARERVRELRLQREEDRARTRVKCRQLAWRLLHAVREAQAVSRRLEVAQGAALGGLRSGDRYRDLGHVRFADFCREALQLHPRTARRRVAVQDILDRVPAARPAYLDGRVDASKLLALRPVLTSENAPVWLALATQLSVRRLAARVAETGSTPATVPDDLDEPTRGRIAFAAPQVVGFAFEHALETAQRVLGWDAPRDACLDAMLMESESSLPWLAASLEESGADSAAGAAPHGSETEDLGTGEVGMGSPAWAQAGRLPWADRVAGHASRARRSGAPGEPPLGGSGGALPWSPSYHRWDYKRAKNTLRALERRLRRIHRLTRETGACAGCVVPAPNREGGRFLVPARAHLDRYRALEGEVRPLFALQARALVHLDTMDAPALVGLRHLGELGAQLLGLSERATWDRFRAGSAFQCCRLLFDRYVRGEVGLGHVLHLADRGGPDTEAMIDRARSVTYRQFRRELRFLGRLTLVGFRVTGRDPGVVTDPEVEGRLRRRLARAGWSATDIERRLEERGLDPPEGTSRTRPRTPSGWRGWKRSSIWRSWPPVGNPTRPRSCFATGKRCPPPAATTAW